MKIIAQSQTPTKVSYIHLAYLSAALNNSISKGELVPVQGVLGTALAAALACAILARKRARACWRGRAVTLSAALGIICTSALFWIVNTIWTGSLRNEQVANHIIETRQFWALREPEIAASVEAAATTNGQAAALAAQYYDVKGGSERAPELTVKAYKFAEEAASKGVRGFVRPENLTNGSEYFVETFKEALEKGKLSNTEQIWARQKLELMEAEQQKENKDKPKL